MRKYNNPQFDGILLVDKPQGWTSHDIVNLIRRRFRQNKVGHCGTLDPMATGLIVIVLNKGTKLSQHLSGDSKSYLGRVRLGEETDSQDADGKITATYDISKITEQAIHDIIPQFSGNIQQIPPMFSALKRGGKTLYDLARAGEEVEREPRAITIHELHIEKIELPEFEFFTNCSKGTYIRTLAYDMGKALKTGAHLVGLRRVSSGQFNIKDAYTIEEIKSWETFDELQPHLPPLPTIINK
jgi:tRNA pseudouridine55 synthase